MPEQITESPKLLDVVGLKKHFPIKKGFLISKQVGAVKAVDGVSFFIREGETLGLVGESGCGKTTIGRLILRAVQSHGRRHLVHRPEAGAGQRRRDG